jgi:hypothetical protein
MIAVIDIEKKRGDTRRMTFKVIDVETKQVVPIGGWTNFLMTLTSVKTPTDDTSKVAQFTGALSTDGSDGRVYFSPAGTEGVGKYYYDCQALDSNGEKITFVEGQYKVAQDRTKD